MNNFKLLILDVDGVMTSGGVYFTESGDEFKKFNTKDGLAINRLTKSGFQVGIISQGRTVNLVQRRADILGIQRVYVGQEKKTIILNQWCSDLKISMDEVAYIGDDVNDMECMKQVGLSACPADAANQIIAIAKLKLKAKGGKGCVREFIEIHFPQLFI